MRIAAFAALIALALPQVSHAAPTLVAAAPAAKSSVDKADHIALQFSETIASPASTFTLVMIAMPGMTNHKPMPVTGFAIKVDGHAISANLPRPLPAGSYRLTWHAVGLDGAPADGSYTFVSR